MGNSTVIGRNGQRREQGHDSDNDQQLNQREATTVRAYAHQEENQTGRELLRKTLQLRETKRRIKCDGKFVISVNKSR